MCHSPAIRYQYTAWLRIGQIGRASRYYNTSNMADPPCASSLTQYAQCSLPQYASTSEIIHTILQYQPIIASNAPTMISPIQYYHNTPVTPALPQRSWQLHYLPCTLPINNHHTHRSRPTLNLQFTREQCNNQYDSTNNTTRQQHNNQIITQQSDNNTTIHQ